MSYSTPIHFNPEKVSVPEVRLPQDCELDHVGGQNLGIVCRCIIPVSMCGFAVVEGIISEEINMADFAHDGL